MSREVLMPNLGAAADEATLIQWFVAEGDEVAVGQPFFEVESDKSTLEVEATEAGRITRLLAQAGDTVAIGSPIALLDVPGDISASPSAAGAPASPAMSRSEPAPAGTTEAGPTRRRVNASPRALALAQRLGVDLDTVKGTGPDGRIVEADVRAAQSRGVPKPHSWC